LKQSVQGERLLQRSRLFYFTHIGDCEVEKKWRLPKVFATAQNDCPMDASRENDRELVRKTFPGLSEQELDEAMVNLREYFEIVAQVSVREFQNEQTTTIDSCESFPTMEERSNNSLKS
jgi:hypothetical protein